jgi:fatty-acyl-CoA synthase
VALAESYAIGPSVPPVRDITLGGLLREAASASPDRVALVAGVREAAARRSWTYAELLDEATTAARALRARFEPGERVAVWGPNSPEWVMLEFASAMAGLILVTVNPAFRASEVEYVLRQSRSAGVVTATEFRGNSMLSIVNDVRARCPELREIIRFDQWEGFLVSLSPTLPTP